MGNCAGRTSTCKYSSSSRCAPSRGSRGPHFPTFPGTLLRSDCSPVRRGTLRLSLAPRDLVCCRAFVFSLAGAWAGGSCPTTPGPVVARSPIRDVDKATGGSPTFPRHPCERMPCAQTPVVSSALALSRPGLLPSGHWKPSALLLVTTWRSILLSTTILIAGLNHTACLLATPGSVPPLAETHAGSLLTGWRGFSQVGLEPYWLAPTG